MPLGHAAFNVETLGIDFVEETTGYVLRFSGRLSFQREEDAVVAINGKFFVWALWEERLVVEKSVSLRFDPRRIGQAAFEFSVPYDGGNELHRSVRSRGAFLKFKPSRVEHVDGHVDTFEEKQNNA